MKGVLLTLLAVGALAQARDANSRIFGGSTAADGVAPFQVSMQGNGSHFCSGSIIDETTVLTAAHCVIGLPPDVNLTIYAGSNQLNSGGVLYNILELRGHSDYVLDWYGNDIGIVKVEEITFNDKVQPIELQTEFLPGGEDCVATGWGTINEIGDVPNDLQELHLKIVPTQICQDVLSLSGNPWEITDKNVCTFSKVGEGLCFGDSGGPLVYNNKIIGIASGVEPCAIGYPDVLTRVSEFLDWIETNRH